MDAPLTNALHRLRLSALGRVAASYGLKVSDADLQTAMQGGPRLNRALGELVRAQPGDVIILYNLRRMGRFVRRRLRRRAVLKPRR